MLSLMKFSYLPACSIYLFDGFMIVAKDGDWRNTVKTHVSRTPQIPMTKQAAGIKKTPNPLR